MKKSEILEMTEITLMLLMTIELSIYNNACKNYPDNRYLRKYKKPANPLAIFVKYFCIAFFGGLIIFLLILGR